MAPAAVMGKTPTQVKTRPARKMTLLKHSMRGNWALTHCTIHRALRWVNQYLQQCESTKSGMHGD
jgi:hypothetical protein